MDQEGGLRVDEDVKPIFDYLKDYKNYINKLLIPIPITRQTNGQQWKKSHNEVSKIVEV